MNIYRIDPDKLTRHRWHFQWLNSYWAFSSYTRMIRADPTNRRWVEVNTYHPDRINFTNIEKLDNPPPIPLDVVAELRKRAAKAPVKARC